MVVSLQILCKDPRTVGAGGAAELELAKQLAEFGKKETGLDQYSIAKFAESLEVSTCFLICHSGLQAHTDAAPALHLLICFVPSSKCLGLPAK